jgi:hypothetical protein
MDTRTDKHGKASRRFPHLVRKRLKPRHKFSPSFSQCYDTGLTLTEITSYEASLNALFSIPA